MKKMIMRWKRLIASGGGGGGGGKSFCFAGLLSCCPSKTA